MRSRSIHVVMVLAAAAGAALAQPQPQPATPSQPPAQPPSVQPLQAAGCESLRAQVEARIASAGVERYNVTVVDAAASAPGRVVGTCDKGARKLMYVQQAGGAAVRAAAASRRNDQPVLTECRDGTVTLGDCRR